MKGENVELGRQLRGTANGFSRGTEITVAVNHPMSIVWPSDFGPTWPGFPGASSVRFVTLDESRKLWSKHRLRASHEPMSNEKENIWGQGATPV